MKICITLILCLFITYMVYAEQTYKKLNSTQVEETETKSEKRVYSLDELQRLKKNLEDELARINNLISTITG